MMTKLKILNIAAFCLLVVLSSCGQQKEYMFNNQLPGFDFHSFDSTPMRSFAEAVDLEDTLRMEEIARSKRINLNYPDPKFGQSILSLAIINNKYAAVVKLLHLGADINYRSLHHDHSTPFLNLCEHISVVQNSLAIMKLLLEHGADVNAIQADEATGALGDKYIVKTTALEYLISYGTLEHVKLLVNSGARLDTYPATGSKSLLYQAVVLSPRLDVLKYLLIDKKIEVPQYIDIHDEGEPSERKITLREEILKRLEVKDARQIQIENEILNYLQTKGL